MTLPNFLMIGAAKSGTTSLASYLNQHPQVFIPPNNKEPNFFIVEGLNLPPFGGSASSKRLYEKIYKLSITNIEDYQRLFEDPKGAKAIGEASVPYLYFPQAAERIKQYIPNVKMIAVLRNPIDRLYSHYLMVREKYLLEPLDLPQALAQEKARIRDNWGWDWHYAAMGMYHTQLQHYWTLFDPAQIKVLLYEDFCVDPVGTVQAICRHIEIDDAFIPDISRRSKVASKSKSLLLNRFLNNTNVIRAGFERLLPQSSYKRFISYGNRWNKMPVPPMPSDIREELRALFQDDILSLQDLIHRDLSTWI